MDKIFQAEYLRQFRSLDPLLFVQRTDRYSTTQKFGNIPEQPPQVPGGMILESHYPTITAPRRKFYSYNEEIVSPLLQPTGLKFPTHPEESTKEAKENLPSNYERSSLRQNRQASYIEPNQRYNEERQPRSARGTHPGDNMPNGAAQSPPKPHPAPKTLADPGSPFNKASHRSRSQIHTDGAMNSIFQNYHRTGTGGGRPDQNSPIASQPPSPNRRHPQVHELLQRQRSGKPEQSFLPVPTESSNDDKFKLQIFNASSTQTNPSDKSSFSSPATQVDLRVDLPEYRGYQQSSPSEHSPEVDSNFEVHRPSASSYLSVSLSGSPRGDYKVPVWQPAPRFHRVEPSQVEQVQNQQPKPFVVQQTFTPYTLKPHAPPVLFNSTPTYTGVQGQLHAHSDGHMAYSTPDFTFESGVQPQKQTAYSQTEAASKSYIRYIPASQTMQGQYSAPSQAQFNPGGLMVGRGVSQEDWRKDKGYSNNFSTNYLPSGAPSQIQKIDLTSQYLPPGFLHTRSDPFSQYPAPDRRPPSTSSNQPMF